MLDVIIDIFTVAKVLLQLINFNFIIGVFLGVVFTDVIVVAVILIAFNNKDESKKGGHR